MTGKLNDREKKKNSGDLAVSRAHDRKRPVAEQGKFAARLVNPPLTRGTADL